MCQLNSNPFCATPGWFITFEGNGVQLHHDITDFEKNITEEIITPYNSLGECLSACLRMQINPAIYN